MWGLLYVCLFPHSYFPVCIVCSVFPHWDMFWFIVVECVNVYLMSPNQEMTIKIAYSPEIEKISYLCP